MRLGFIVISETDGASQPACATWTNWPSMNSSFTAQPHCVHGKVLIVIAVILALAVPAHAEDQPAAWTSHRSIADWTSTGLVGFQLAADGWTARHHLGNFACRVGLTVGAAELVKHTVHRTRPDGSDAMSFYSEHTALATVSSGWRFQVGIPLAIGSGYLRMGAGKHFATDVAVGSMAGLLAMKVCE